MNSLDEFFKRASKEVGKLLRRADEMQEPFNKDFHFVAVHKLLAYLQAIFTDRKKPAVEESKAQGPQEKKR